MNIELVVIGNEVLSGSTVNTNGAFIGKKLFQSGYELARQTVLPDEEQKLRRGIEEAISRNDLVLTTGGLGPTIDDVSRKIVADIFDSSFEFKEEIFNQLIKKYGKEFPTFKDQATLPIKATPVLNELGTAYGLIFQEKKKTLIMLPGVPHEMEKMLVEHVIPFIEKTFPLTKRPHRKSIYFSQIPELKVDPVLREMKERYPAIEFGIYPALGRLAAQLTSYESLEELEAPLKELEEKFSEYFYYSDIGGVEGVLQELFLSKGWTLSAAESCTGGSVSAKITRLPSASQYFLGSVISYSNQVKKDLLNVPAELLEKHGAVSSEVVSAMAEGVQKLTNSDFSIAVSGIAGPTGGTSDKPVGTVWYAVKKKGEKPHVWTVKNFGSRDMIIKRSANELLSTLYHRAKK